MRAHARGVGRQQGLVLITSLLLLLIITILAVSMFRSFDVQERIAGNIREKQRATQAAEQAEQYAEYWLTSVATSTTDTTCSQVINVNQDLSGVQICSNTLEGAGTAGASVATTPSWQLGGWMVNGNAVGNQYTPSDWISTSGGTLVNATNPSAGTYLAPPSFYIAYLGTCEDGVGSCYQIDAAGYGGTDAAVSIVESTYELSPGVKNLRSP